MRGYVRVRPGLYVLKEDYGQGNTMSIERNRLNRASSFKVMSWLEKNKDEAPGKTRSQILDAIKADTGISLTKDQLKGIVRDTGLDIRWKGKEQPPRNASVDRTRALAGQLLAVAREVEILAERLGERFNLNGEISIDTIRDIMNGNHNPNAPKRGEVPGAT